MLNVLLADDEPMVIKGLTGVINWEELGFSICGQASNGEEALSLMALHAPDLLITDVRMPRMDGIELAARVREEYPRTAVIILSGYDEFDYAQSALKAGVSEYLLKPFKRNQLEETLRRIRQQLIRRQKQQAAYENMQNELQRYRPVLKNQFLAELAEGYASDEAPFKRLADLGTQLAGGPYYLICVDADISRKLLLTREDADLMHVYQRDVLMLRLQDLGNTECFERENRWYFIIEETPGEADFEDALEQACREAIEAFSQISGFTISVGISAMYEELSELSLAKSDCSLALEYRLSSGGETCIWAAHTGAILGSAVPFNSIDLEGIFNNMRLLDINRVQELIQRQFGHLQKNNAPAGQFYSLSNLILLELYSLVSENSMENALGDKILGQLKETQQCKTADELLELCLDSARGTLDELKKHTSESSSEIAGQIIRYIDEHLAEDISLQTLAKHIHISRNYLCSLFKRELNETFVSYLTRVRMAKAKELLRDTNMRSYDIAYAVGYSDYVYFAQVFKKQVEMTTTEYREAFVHMKQT